MGCVISYLIDALDSVDSFLCFNVFSLDASVGPSEPEKSKKGSLIPESSGQSRGPVPLKSHPENSAIKE